VNKNSVDSDTELATPGSTGGARLLGSVGSVSGTLLVGVLDAAAVGCGVFVGC
jgi:hypothetical protein